MERQEQEAGEKRVRTILIDPLVRRGLARPSTVTVVQFEAMQEDMCQRLAYMTEVNLAALADQVAANPGGKEKDRFPIANTILQWAADIQPPGDDASPLVRAIFAHGLGRGAVAEGWAPELLAEVKRRRQWPKPYGVAQIRDGGLQAARQMQVLDERLAQGRQLTAAEADWCGRRKAVLDRCAELARKAEA
ncbi:hypothetical protein [Mangrovicoccus sp. HB161399]|uniref:hypothetical protein n=1 Tax=Mangrovicoccus sp. HB161399 TaxID=2720392 RepID=UPI001551BEAC|nr:hypothetical protein [Mangrovicoccus sp. HB161399]